MGLPLSRSSRSALKVATQAVVEAGDLLLKHIGSQKEVKYKEGRANIVTDVDLLTEKQIITFLRSEYPDYNILSEESKSAPTDSPYTWIIDPLDGTNNYVLGIPFFSVTLSLASREEVLLGLVYDPVRKELFKAEKGKGAFLSDRPVQVSQRSSMETSSIGCDLGYDADEGRRMLEIIRASWPKMHGLRIMGSAALGLAYVACGRLDLYLHPCLYPWDIAASILLTREAGGKATNWEGRKATIHSKQIIAANPTIHKDSLKLVRGPAD